MSPSTPTIKKYLDENKDNTNPNLLITFPSGTQIPHPATRADKQSTSQAPTFSLARTCLGTQAPGTKYIAVSLDLDAPSPSFPILSPILHYLHTDLTAAVKDTATETWVQLTASSVTAGDHGVLDRPLASWLAPAPPGFSAPHRYVFLVWEQPEKTTGEQMRAQLGWTKGEPGLWKKARFDFEEFVRKLSLKEIVAGTWMVVG